MAIQIPNPGTGNGATGDNEFVLWSKVKSNFEDQTNAASRLIGKGVGNVPEISLYGVAETGLGGTSKHAYTQSTAPAFHGAAIPNGSHFFTSSGLHDAAVRYSCGLYIKSDVDNAALTFKTGKIRFSTVMNLNGNDLSSLYSGEIYTTLNATKDANGFLKGASPVVDMYDNKIDLNHDAEQQGGITLEKLGVGDYLIKGSLGFAQDGWYIETPKDANGNVLVAVVYEQLANNNLSIKTYAKRFDDETGDIVANLLKPRDIPDGRFISLRLHELPVMPETKTEV